MYWAFRQFVMNTRQRTVEYTMAFVCTHKRIYGPGINMSSLFAGSTFLGFDVGLYHKAQRCPLPLVARPPREKKKRDQPPKGLK